VVARGVRDLAEVQPSGVRKPDLLKAPAVQRIGASADEHLRVHPAGAQDHHPANSDASHCNPIDGVKVWRVAVSLTVAIPDLATIVIRESYGGPAWRRPILRRRPGSRLPDLDRVYRAFRMLCRPTRTSGSIDIFLAVAFPDRLIASFIAGSALRLHGFEHADESHGSRFRALPLIPLPPTLTGQRCA